MPLESKIKHIIRRVWPFIFILAVLFIAGKEAVARIYNVDFVPTNGDFQTYNTLRRFLDGQLPYTDYANYLGMGVIFCLAPFLALHNSFAGSLFVSTFVTSVLFILMVSLILYLITGKGLVSATLGLCTALVTYSRLFTMLPWIGGYLDYIFMLMAQPGNSARTVRMSWPFLLVLLVLVLLRLYHRKHTQPADPAALINSKAFCAMLGFFCGIGIVWSNDFGFGAVIAASLLLLVLHLIKSGRHVLRRAVLPALCYIGALAAGFMGAVLLVTGGHWRSWFSHAGGVASWQHWYYGTRAAEKIHSISDLFTSGWEIPLILAFVAGSCVWFVYKAVKKNLTPSHILYQFLCLSIFIAFAIYIYGSGYNGFPEGMMLLIFCTLLGVAARFILRLLARPRLVVPARSVLAVLLCFVLAVKGWGTLRAGQAYANANFPAYDNYLPALQGVTYLHDSVQSQVPMTSGQPVFSLYATALEVENGTFQPTGTDYIIHALGDEARASYLQQFEAGGYPYVQTMHPAYAWTPWIVRANWDFYRLLYKNYTPIADALPWMLWQRTEAPEPNLVKDVAATCTPVQTASGEWELRVTLPVEGDYIVDVEIAYRASKDLSINGLQTLRYSVFVDDPSIDGDQYGYSEYSIQTASDARNLPVFVSNGSGSLRLSSVPNACTSLAIESVQVINIYESEFF